MRQKNSTNNLMKAINFSMALLFPLMLTACGGSIKNARTDVVMINGNCNMCKETIESAALEKGMAEAEWNENTRQASITYDSTRTNKDAVLKRIALAGYDNENYLAPDNAYAQLPACCLYERTGKHIEQDPNGGGHHHADAAKHDHEAAADQPAADTVQQVANEKADHLKPVFDAYFALKDALVTSDANAAAGKASDLAKVVEAVQMERMNADVHGVWMEVMTPLVKNARAIAGSKDLEKQRTAFAALAGPMAQLVKVAPRPGAIYYDHCPMYNGGSNWLSQEKDIKNPFYGAQMLTCGSLKETIQPAQQK